MTVISFFELPEPILDLIYIYSGNHTNQKKIVEKELRFDYAMNVMNKYKKQCMNRCKHVSTKYFGYRHIFGIIVKNNCDNYEKECLFNNLKHCNCCIRHSRNIPYNITDTYDEYLYMDDEKDKKKCSCKCRHYKRILSMTYNPQLYVDGYFQNLMD
jgi:hypothetical protein